MIAANAAITLIKKKDLKKIPGFERNSNPVPLCYRCHVLPGTELSKPHESGRVWVNPLSVIMSTSETAGHLLP